MVANVTWGSGESKNGMGNWDGLGGYNFPGMANSPKAAQFGGCTHKAGCWEAKWPKMGRDR